MKKIVITTLLVLLIDQITKIYVKTHFELNAWVQAFPGLKISFVENPGMAYGVHFGGIFISRFTIGIGGVYGSNL